MDVAPFLGRFATLWVRRLIPHGAVLVDRADAPFDDPGLLLPRREVPPDLAVGATVEVFVYLDSEDRPVATLRPPRVALGEVAFLTVADITPTSAPRMIIAEVTIRS